MKNQKLMRSRYNFCSYKIAMVKSKKLLIPFVFVLFIITPFFGWAQDDDWGNVYDVPRLNRPKVEFPLMIFPSTFVVNNFSKNMKSDLSNAYGAEFSFSIFPSNWQPLALDFRGGMSRIESNSEKHFYILEERSVKFQSNFNHALVGLKYVNIESRNLAKFNLSFYAGYGFMRGRTRIDDPDDEGALYNQIFLKDRTFMYGSELTLEFNLSKDRKNVNYRGQGVFLQLSAGVYRGGDISYVNVQNLIDEAAYFDDFLNNEYVKAFDDGLDVKRFTPVFTTPLRFTNTKISLVNRF